jgi:general L-amino acid transport system permease protein
MADVAMPRDPRTSSEAPKRGFYDKDVQGIFWQVIVLGTIGLLFYYLYRNMQHNLEVRQIKTGYAFLSRESGFPLAESLIPYAPTDTYAKALLVGFLNTVHVAVLGIIAATLLGVVVGVSTMSKNLLLRNLTAGYIHFLRNIPVLLQIILWYTILINPRFLPNPREATATAGVFFTQRGVFFPVPEPAPGWYAAIVGLILAIIGTYYLSRWARLRQEKTGQTFPAFLAGTGLIVGVPFLLWLVFGAPTTMEWPTLKGFNIDGAGRITPEFTAMLFGLTLYTSAFIGEIVRAGILSVPKGQTEAARALGLKESVILRKVTLPQALRVIIPPLTSQYLNVTKNSSLAAAIGYADLVYASNTTGNQTGQVPEAISIVMLVFLSTSLLTSLFMNWYNKRIQLVER